MVAVKVPRRDLAPDGTWSPTSEDRDPNVARFMAEARVTAQLEHPAIVPVYDVGRSADGTRRAATTSAEAGRAPMPRAAREIEWVADVHGEQADPMLDDEPAPSTERGDAGKRRVRSGNTASDHKWCRAASRSSVSALTRGPALGFRVAKTLTPKQR